MAGRTARTENSKHQGDEDPTNHFVGFIRKPIHRPLGCQPGAIRMSLHTQLAKTGRSQSNSAKLRERGRESENQ